MTPRDELPCLVRKNPRENSFVDRIDVDSLRDNPPISRSAVCPTGISPACYPHQGEEEPGCGNGLDDNARLFCRRRISAGSREMVPALPGKKKNQDLFSSMNTAIPRPARTGPRPSGVPVGTGPPPQSGSLGFCEQNDLIVPEMSAVETSVVPSRS